MKLRTFSNYEEYVKVQSETNKRKISHVWVSSVELERIARHIRKTLPNARFGLCHGVRNGFEVAQLRDRLGIEVIGTEISDTADRFDHVIQWDFHEVKDEWIGSVDFIYSNSWDHSYDPVRLFHNWAKCLSPNGLLYLEWTRNHLPKSVYGADCFGATLAEMVGMLKAEFLVKDILRINRVGLAGGFRDPVGYLKQVIAPTRVIVAAKTGG